MPTIVITGCATGFGRVTALYPAERAYAGPLEVLPLDDVRAQLEVNLLAYFGVRVVVVAPGANPTAIWNTALRRAHASAMYAELGGYAPLAAAIEQRARRACSSPRAACCRMRFGSGACGESYSGDVISGPGCSWQ